MVKFTKSKSTGSPSSVIGLMRFFDADTPGPKLSPMFVVVVSFIIALIVIIMHIMT